MRDDEPYDAYVQATLAQFDVLVTEAIERRPTEAGALSRVDFAKARYEIMILLDRNLTRGEILPALSENVQANNANQSSKEQYLPITPAPWP